MMTTDSDRQRRRAERVQLRMPLAARLAGSNVVLSDISVVGAGIEHHVRIPVSGLVPLSFRWERQLINVECHVVRTRLETMNHGRDVITLYKTGLNFSRDNEALESALERRITKAFARQRSDAYADPEIQKAITDSSGAMDLRQLFPEARPRKAFVRCSLVAGRWKKEWVTDPSQPESGFTVSADESDREIDLLCRTYSRATVEEKRLIRIFSHLSVSEPSDTPRNKFNP